MYQHQELQQLSQELKSLLKQYGFDQFVLVAHQCDKDKLFTCATERPCGLMKAMYQAVEYVDRTTAGVDLLTSDSNN